MEEETIEVNYVCRNCGYRDTATLPLEDGEYIKQNPRCNRCGNLMVEDKE